VGGQNWGHVPKPLGASTSLEKPMPLTDAQIKQFKAPKDAGKHFDGAGLYL